MLEAGSTNDNRVTPAAYAELRRYLDCPGPRTTSAEAPFERVDNPSPALRGFKVFTKHSRIRAFLKKFPRRQQLLFVLTAAEMCLPAVQHPQRQAACREGVTIAYRALRGEGIGDEQKFLEACEGASQWTQGPDGQQILVAAPFWLYCLRASFRSDKERDYLLSHSEALGQCLGCIARGICPNRDDPAFHVALEAACHRWWDHCRCRLPVADAATAEFEWGGQESAPDDTW